MQTGVDEGTQLRVVEQTLLRTYGDRVAAERIRAEVEQGMASFGSARIRTFIPVLLQRRVAERLRRA